MQPLSFSARSSMRAAAAASAIGIAAALLAPAAHAQQPMAHGDHAMAGTTNGPANASTKAFQRSDEKMMKDMRVPYTGDADRDFVQHMIPHHEGAVAMAEVQLKYGRDPVLRKMAEDIVQAQQQEIAFMKKWLAEKGTKPGS